MKDPQVALGDTNVKQNMHEDKLTLIFDKFSLFQEEVLYNICTVMERVGKMQASTLTGIIYQGSSHLEVLVEQISELEK